jgi:hypothetical protein
MSDPQTTMDGPHTYKPDVPFYDWAVLTATDVDGVRYWFHVPTASLALEELAASLAPRIISGGPDPQTPATEAGRRVAFYDGPDTPITVEEILAIEAEARASLDVDVLARAIGRCNFEWDEVPLEGPQGIEGVSATFNTHRFAVNVAREYAVLAKGGEG